MTDDEVQSVQVQAPAPPMTQEQALARVNDFRAMITRGERPNQAEMKAALAALRAGRSAASRATSKSKAPAKAIDLKALFAPDVPKDS